MTERIPKHEYDEAVAAWHKRGYEIYWLRQALLEIQRGRGPFKRDPMEHAESVIEAMKDVASRALAGEKDVEWDAD